MGITGRNGKAVGNGGNKAGAEYFIFSSVLTLLNLRCCCRRAKGDTGLEKPLDSAVGRTAECFRGATAAGVEGGL